MSDHSCNLGRHFLRVDLPNQKRWSRAITRADDAKGKDGGG